MKSSTRVKIGAGVSLACDVVAIGAGAAGLAFHIKELKDGKSYDVLKDGVRDLGSGILIVSGASGIYRTCKSYKTMAAVAEAADDITNAAVTTAKEISNAAKGDDAE